MDLGINDGCWHQKSETAEYYVSFKVFPKEWNLSLIWSLDPVVNLPKIRKVEGVQGCIVNKQISRVQAEGNSLGWKVQVLLQIN